MQQFLVPVSVFTLAAATWLGVMENLLRHAGYSMRIVEACFIAAQSVATLFAVMVRARQSLRIALVIGGVALIALGGSAMVRLLKDPHFEAYVLVIGAALVVQGLLTFFTLGKKSRLRSQPS